jgi:hypothetical protein
MKSNIETLQQINKVAKQLVLEHSTIDRGKNSIIEISDLLFLSSIAYVLGPVGHCPF